MFLRFPRGVMLEGEDRDARGDERHDDVFVKRVAFAEDGEV